MTVTCFFTLWHIRLLRRINYVKRIHRGFLKTFARRKSNNKVIPDNFCEKNSYKILMYHCRWLNIGKKKRLLITNSNTLATSWEELTHWKRLWCWEGSEAGGEGDEGGWDGWMASPTQWTWVWVNCGSLWWTVRPGVLQFMGSQRAGHEWVTKLNWWILLSSSQVRVLRVILISPFTFGQHPPID